MQLPAADFIAQAEDAAGADLPHVNEEFDEFFKCGILAHGFLRLQRSLGIAARVTPSLVDIDAYRRRHGHARGATGLGWRAGAAQKMSSHRASPGQLRT